MAKDFLGKKLLVFTSHPDDETFASGTVYENYKAGGETYMVCATSGERGRSHLKKKMSDAQLARIRERELLAAAKVLHVKKVFFIHLPDGKVRENEKKLFKEGLRIVTKIRPEQMISFGPDGISAHWDHIITGKVGLRIAKKLKIPLMAFTLPKEAIRKQAERRKFFMARRKFGVYAPISKHREAEIIIKVNVAIKRKALRLHTSQFTPDAQTPFMNLSPRMAQRMFGHEHFVKEKI